MTTMPDCAGAGAEDAASERVHAIIRPRLRRRLLAWYDRHRRTLPWRAPPGGGSEPYHVWLSEIMLQQTTVAAVIPYFERFVRRWPGIRDLAAADLDEILVAWQGLGYYARARNLHACARVVAEAHDGRFPETEDALRALPGVGAYTAAAIAAIAFGCRAAPVDGNVIRVLARLYGVGAALPQVRSRIDDLALALMPRARAGDFAQALMDLGATVCTPRKPVCGACPWNGDCRARALGAPERFPVKAAKKARPVRHGIAFWLERPGGLVLLRRRPPSGLLGGMMEIPSTPWRPQPWTLVEAISAAPAEAPWRSLPGSVAHTFTHFQLELTILVGAATEAAAGQAITAGRGAAGQWCSIHDLDRLALPTVMRKVIGRATGNPCNRPPI